MLVWAALQLALPGTAALADALASRDGVTATAHVEDTSRASCVRVHDTECAFCQLLSTCAAPEASAAPDFVAGAEAESLDSATLTPRLEPRRGAILPRAPPQV